MSIVARIVFLLLAVACACSDLFALAVKLYIDLFAVSRSGFKTFLFFGFLILFALGPGSIKGFAARKARSLSVLLISLVAILLMVGAIEYLLLANRYHLPLDKGLLFYGLGDIASSELYHNHVSKAPIAFLLQSFLSPELLYQLDLGAPFLGVIPGWILLIHALIYITFALLLWLQSLNATQLKYSVRLVFILASFTLFKNVLDGGAFFFETAVAIPVFTYGLVTIGQLNRAKIYTTFSMLIGVICLLLGAYFGPDTQSFLLDLIPLLFLYLVLFAFGQLLDRGQSLRAYLSISLLAVLYLLYLFPAEGTKSAKYPIERALRTIEADSVLSVFIEREIEDSNANYEILDSASLGRMHLFYIRNKEKLTGHQLTNLGLDLNFYEFVQHFVDCDPGVSYPLQFRLIPYSEEDFTKVKPKRFGMRTPLETAKFSRGSSGGYLLDLILKPCVPLPMDVLTELLREFQAPPLIIIPPDDLPLL